MIDPLIFVEPPLLDRVKELLASKEYTTIALSHLEASLLDFRERQARRLNLYAGVTFGLPSLCDKCRQPIQYVPNFYGLLGYCECSEKQKLTMWQTLCGSDLMDVYAARYIALQEAKQDVRRAAAYAYQLYSMFSEVEQSGSVAWMRSRAIFENEHSPVDHLIDPSERQNALSAINRETGRILPRIAADLIREPLSDPLQTDSKGVLLWDSIAAKHLARLGPLGKQMANEIRSESRKLLRQQPILSEMQKELHASAWRLWGIDCRFIQVLSVCLWHDVVSQIPQNTKLAAIQLPLVEPYLESLHRHAVHDGNSIRSKRGTLLARINPKDAVLADGPLAEIMKRATTPAVPKVLLYVTNAAFEKARKNYIDPLEHGVPVVEIPGGLSELARRVDCQPTDVRYALDFLWHGEWVSSKGNRLEALLTSYHEQPTQGRKAILSITPNIGLFKSKPGEFLWFVPRHLPPLIGDARTHQAQLLLFLWVTLEILKRRVEYFRSGGRIRITDKKWHSLANAAGLNKKMLPQVIAAWQQPDGKAPAFLIQTEVGVWQLSEAHADVHRRYMDAGKLSETRSRGGQASQAKRNGKKVRKKG